MSLIADALKAAQREKAKRAAANEPDARPSFFSVPAPPARKRKLDVEWRKLALPAGVVAALLIAGWGLSSLLRNNAKNDAERTALLVDTSAITAEPVAESTPYILEELDSGDDDVATDVPPARSPSPRREAPVRDFEPAPPLPPQTQRPVRSEAASGLKIEVQQVPLVGGNPLVAQALAAYNRGDFGGARDYYERALAAGIASPEIYNNLGTAYRNLGDLARAEQAYQSAIALNPRSASAWSNLGVVLYSAGRKREATAAYQEAIKLDGANASTKVNLAILYMEGAVYSQAKQLLEEALAVAPGSAEAHYTYAQLLESTHDSAGAIRHYETFLSVSGGRYAELEKRIRTRLDRLRSAQ